MIIIIITIIIIIITKLQHKNFPHKIYPKKTNLREKNCDTGSGKKKKKKKITRCA